MPHPATIMQLALRIAFELKKHLEMALYMPHEVAESLPSFDATISTLLKATLPQCSNTFTLCYPTTPFSKVSPTIDWPEIQAYGVPNPKFLESLSTPDLQVVVREGVQSISIFNQEKMILRFPLWTVLWWHSVTNARQAQAVWARARTWASRARANCRDEAVLALDQLGWTTRLTSDYAGGEVLGLKLSVLLTPSWVGEDVIDLMLESLSREAGRKEDIMVCSNAYTRLLIQRYQLEAVTDQSLMTELDRAVEAGKDIYFIENVNQNHWIAIKVSVKEQTIFIGDSLQMSHAQNLQKALRSYFAEVFQSVMHTRVLEIGKQTDYISCAICAVNALRHDLLGERIWEGSRADENCMLVRICQYFLAEVRVVY